MVKAFKWWKWCKEKGTEPQLQVDRKKGAQAISLQQKKDRSYK